MNGAPDSDAVLAFQEAASAVGLEATVAEEPGDLRLDVNGVLYDVTLKRVSTASPTAPPRMLPRDMKHAGAEGYPVRVLIADKIGESAKDMLRAHDWGWLDLRGHLHLSAPGLFVDARVPAFNPRPERSSAFSGTVGLEVACALLMEPERRPSVRGLARQLSRAPSTVSDALKALSREGLIRQDKHPLLPDLFWETAAAWRRRSDPLWLSAAPEIADGRAVAALKLGLRDVESTTGWALADTLAASAYGAPIGMRGDHPPDFYVPSHATAHRAVQLLGQASDPADRRASVRVAPVSLVCTRRVDPHGWTGQVWPLAHPVFVALDLARDPDRGRQVLVDWQPPARWRRVW